MDSRNKNINRVPLWLPLVITGAVSGIGAIVLNSLFPDWRLIHYPLHAAVESVGSFAAFVVAVLVIGLRKHGHLGSSYTWVAAALVGMGFLDGMHSILHAGNGFVWLHSVATLIGGVVFSFVWIAEKPAIKKIGGYAPFIVLAVSVALGISSLMYPEFIPKMVIDGQFSLWAKVTNIIGGIGFLIASIYFVVKAKKESDTRNRLIFSSHCLLFGISAVIFEFSIIWDAAWWLWHALRIIAYMIAVLFYFKLAKKIEEELAVLKDDLEIRVTKRTQELAIETSRAKALGHQNDLILNAAADGIYGVDLNGLCTFVNPAAARMLGWDAQEIIGMSNHDVMHHTKADGSHYPRIECPIYAAFMDGKIHTVEGEVFWRKDGASFPVEYTSTPIYVDNKITGAVVVFRDVSEQKEIRGQLIQSSKMATLGEMATGVAHELNQPLNVISMAIHNIQRKASHNNIDYEYLVKKLNKVEAQINRAASIIDHMRIFGRKPSAERELLCPVKAVESSLDMIKEQLRLSDIMVKVEMMDNGYFILAHQVQIEQVILNLLANARDALKSKDENDKYIIVRTKKDDSEKNVLIEIEDNGGGIDPKALPRIFEPFYTTKEIGEGTGLGLSISYGIINDMGGSLEAKNVNDGSCFTITLPLNSMNDVS
ncbi:MAG: PAS domain S-box protein [Rhodospirillaceae bacterium]|nr:PAS domain S-box protein [Rhodospirillaceae bacterium]